MSNLFDGLQNKTFNLTATVFGYYAIWAPSDGSDSVEARVHFKDPTEAEGVSEVEYPKPMPTMEYKEGDFPGLYQAVQVDRKDEYVTIDGTEYYVENIALKYDGKTYRADLQVKDSNL